MISVLCAALWAGGMLPGVGVAERIEIRGTVAAGTGISMAGSDGRTLVARSPTLLAADVGLVHPQRRWLEFAAGVMVEFGGAIRFGVDPKVRMFLPFERLRPFLVVGVPIVVAPNTLLGAKGGLGLEVPFHRHVGVLVEASATAFFWGDDLMERSVLTKLDTALGLRTYF